MRLEGKGIDFALEITASGERAKDLKSNVTRYAELGIDEYFVLDLHRELLHGWRLPAPGSRAYQRAADAHVQRQAAEEQLLEALAEIARLKERLKDQE